MGAAVLWVLYALEEDLPQAPLPNDILMGGAPAKTPDAGIDRASRPATDQEVRMCCAGGLNFAATVAAAPLGAPGSASRSMSLTPTSTYCALPTSCACANGASALEGGKSLDS